MFEIGTTLRDARVRRDISLQRAEEDTKIRVKYIQAMENEDFDVLPGGTYVKGFLRTYADYLGIDHQLMLDEYNEHYGSGEHREHIIHAAMSAHGEPAPRSRRNQKNRNYIFVALLAIAIIAVLAYLGWGNASSGQPTLGTTTETETSAPARSTTAATSEAGARTATTATQAAQLDNLVLTSTKTDNWVEVHKDSAAGDIIWANMLSPGESKSLDRSKLGVARVWLTIGSAVGLEVSVNGKDQEVPGKTGAVYLITGTGLEQG